MNKILRKLRSDRGASITFALLLFLICAIISSVVIVAGTTAAGRMSGMVSSEQQYYTISSTAKLIQEQLDNKQVTLIKTGSGDDEKIYFVSDDGTKATVVDSITSVKSVAQYTAYRICKKMYGETPLAVTIPGQVQQEAVVAVTETVQNDLVSFTIKGTSEKDDYTFNLEFATTATSTPIKIGSIDGTRIDYTWTLGHAGSYDVSR